MAKENILIKIFNQICGRQI